MNLPLALTASRVVIAPLFAWSFIAGTTGNHPAALWIALGLLVVGELSDAFDGHIARSRGQVTDLGKIFDPVADSLYRLTAFLVFMYSGIIPLWMFMVFFYRDLFLSLLRIVCASRGTVLAARASGKIKAIVQAGAIFLVVGIALCHTSDCTLVPPYLFGYPAGFWPVAVAALLTVLSVVDYLVPNAKHIAAMATPNDQNNR